MPVPFLYDREVHHDGSITLRCNACTVRYRSPRSGLIVIEIAGRDCVQIDTAIFEELRASMGRDAGIKICIDIGEAAGQVLNIAGWTHFLASNQRQIQELNILVTSKVLLLTILVIKHLSRVVTPIHTYSTRISYEKYLVQSENMQ